jgi:hypothetical protein
VPKGGRGLCGTIPKGPNWGFIRANSGLIRPFYVQNSGFSRLWSADRGTISAGPPGQGRGPGWRGFAFPGAQQRGTHSLWGNLLSPRYPGHPPLEHGSSSPFPGPQKRGTRGTLSGVGDDPCDQGHPPAGFSGIFPRVPSAGADSTRGYSRLPPPPSSSNSASGS